MGAFSGSFSFPLFASGLRAAGFLVAVGANGSFVVEVAVRDLVDLVLDSADAAGALVRAVALVVAIERDAVNPATCWRYWSRAKRVRRVVASRARLRECLQGETHPTAAGPFLFQTRTNPHFSRAAREGLTVSSLVTASVPWQGLVDLSFVYIPSAVTAH